MERREHCLPNRNVTSGLKPDTEPSVPGHGTIAEPICNAVKQSREQDEDQRE
jgi:hypothetical protein